MKPNINKNEFIILFFRVTIIAIALIGIFAPTANSFLGQFWFFTLQTNLFIVLIMSILVICKILNFLKIETTFIKNKIFSYLRLLTTFFITITGLIYCFILAPVAIVTNNLMSITLSYRDIFLHIFVPVLSIIEYFVLSEKVYIKIRSSFIFLIYPIIYVLSIFLRAGLGGTAFPGGSVYPYFFIDPTFYNQGWLAVCGYSIILLIGFYLLSLLFIYFNNKIKNDS